MLLNTRLLPFVRKGLPSISPDVPKPYSDRFRIHCLRRNTCCAFVCCMCSYLSRSAPLHLQSIPHLFLLYVRPRRLVSPPTLARWICWVLFLSDVDPSFVAHFVRGAVASLAFSLGGSLADILRSADWSRNPLFGSFTSGLYLMPRLNF